MNPLLEKLNLVNKLSNAYQCCKACGSKYGVYSVGCSSNWIGTCDVCGLENVAVTETRDYGYLYTGQTKLRKEIEAMKTKDKKKETKYSSKITSVEVTREDDFVALTTTVSIDDEGGGEFLVITSDADSIQLDFEEFDEVVKAVKLLREQSHA